MVFPSNIKWKNVTIWSRQRLNSTKNNSTVKHSEPSLNKYFVSSKIFPGFAGFAIRGIFTRWWGSPVQGVFNVRHFNIRQFCFTWLLNCYRISKSLTKNLCWVITDGYHFFRYAINMYVTAFHCHWPYFYFDENQWRRISRT